MHLPAYAVVGRFADLQAPLDKPTLIVITGDASLLAWALMLSQAMESVTRAFYARADLDLILSSPVAAGQGVRGAHRARSRCRSPRWRCCSRRRSSTCW